MLMIIMISLNSPEFWATYKQGESQDEVSERFRENIETAIDNLLGPGSLVKDKYVLQGWLVRKVFIGESNSKNS